MRLGLTQLLPRLPNLSYLGGESGGQGTHSNYQILKSGILGSNLHTTTL